MNGFKIFCLSGILTYCMLACSGKGSEGKSSAEPNIFLNYNLDAPAQVFELPEELDEISGLATISADLLLANEDESGNLYLFNIQDGSVQEKQKWGKDGDYEGAAIVKNSAYIVDSEGTVYQISNYTSKDPEVQEFKNKSLKDCDAEGLTYLKEKHALLIACKEGSGKEERKLYSFSLESLVLHPEPYRTLSFKEIEDFILTTGLDKLSLNMKKFLDPEGESGILFPSGIAIHPITKDLYVLSSRSRLLVVYSADGKLKDVGALKNELFRQPEALTFTPNGDLYIGNEANEGKANILKFEYVQE